MTPHIASTDTNSLHDLILASRVEHTPVYNLSGDRIGHVEDLSIEKISGQVRYALMSCGGFLGIGDRLHPLPWDVLDYDPEKGGYVAPLSKEELKLAPNYSAEELAAFGGQDVSYRDQVFTYYAPFGAVPYW